MTQMFGISNFGHCDLFEICVLGFGIYKILCFELGIIHFAI